MRHTFRGEGSTVTVITYPTVKDCFWEFLPEEAREPGTVYCESDGDGENEAPVEEMPGIIEEHHRCWGFARRPKSEIHVWIGKHASFNDVLNLFAHEYGHLEPRQDDEELRADSFARVAVRAFETAKEVMWSEALRS